MAARPRAADDFSAIRARLEELRRERVQQVRGDAAEPMDGNSQMSRSKEARRNVELRLLRDRGRISR